LAGSSFSDSHLTVFKSIDLIIDVQIEDWTAYNRILTMYLMRWNEEKKGMSR
jgi:hypothetical protein